MTDAEINALVLGVLAGQSPGYLAHPDASAFVAAGLEVIDDPRKPNPLDAAAVTAALERLQALGQVEIYQDVAGEDVLDEGWIITEAGRALVGGEAPQRRS